MPMVVEKTSTDRKGKHYWDSRKGRRGKKKLAPVQVLYDTCREVFANCGPGVVPSPEKLEKLKAVLDGITEADVGLQQNLHYFRARKMDGYPAVTYVQLYECETFSIGLFCLPPSAVIGLHDHPQMTVFSKILFGTMHKKSLDWVTAAPTNIASDVNPPNVDAAPTNAAPDINSPNGNATPTNGAPNVSPPNEGGIVSAGARLAKVKVDEEVTAPCNSSILFPADGGNLHRFTAVTSCALLDVLGPPYNGAEGRDCTYYHEYPFAHFSADGLSVSEEDKGEYSWLEEVEKSEGSIVYGKTYSGPKIKF